MLAAAFERYLQDRDRGAFGPALAQAGLPVEAGLLARDGWVEEPGLGRVWVGERPPPDPEVGTHWLDTVEVVLMTCHPGPPRVPGAKYAAEALDRLRPEEGYLARRPVERWQWQAFARLAELEVRHGAGPTPGGAWNERDPARGRLGAQAAAYAWWFGKTLPDYGSYAAAARGVGASWPAVHQLGAEEWAAWQDDEQLLFRPDWLEEDTEADGDWRCPPDVVRPEVVFRTHLSTAVGLFEAPDPRAFPLRLRSVAPRAPAAPRPPVKDVVAWAFRSPLTVDAALAALAPLDRFRWAIRESGTDGRYVQGEDERGIRVRVLGEDAVAELEVWFPSAARGAPVPDDQRRRMLAAQVPLCLAALRAEGVRSA